MQNKLLKTVLCGTICLCFVSVMAQDKVPTTEEQTQVPAPQEESSYLSGTKQNTDPIVDFPNRSSLGTLELAPLPSLTEPVVAQPQEIDFLKTSLPTEQLIGRISPEMFRELADIERANVFLRLQMQREQLKQDLEEMQARYRQTRLDEIEKRENVIKERIAWWQEQEGIRAKIEEQKSAAALLDQQILEAEAIRQQMRQKAMSANEGVGAFPLADIYKVLDIQGKKGQLVARLQPVGADNVIMIKEGQTTPSGHLITKITATTVSGRMNNQESSVSIVFIPQEQ